jgi:hypothetical protein
MPTSAWAATHGVYLITAMPFYAHPVTGEVEDSGQNPAIGQGMTESVLGPEALFEVQADGTSYVTVRFSLIENIQDVHIAVQADAEAGFVDTAHTVMREDIANDAADIRFAVPDEAAIARAEFYVIPMGRVVVFYMAFADPVPADASAAPGGFIVSTKVDAALAAAQREQGAGTVAGSSITPESAAAPAVEQADIDPDAGLAVYTSAPGEAAQPAPAGPAQDVPYALYAAIAVAVLAVVVLTAVLFYRAQARSLRAAMAGGEAASGSSGPPPEDVVP